MKDPVAGNRGPGRDRPQAPENESVLSTGSPPPRRGNRTAASECSHFVTVSEFGRKKNRTTFWLLGSPVGHRIRPEVRALLTFRHVVIFCTLKKKPAWWSKP